MTSSGDETKALASTAEPGSPMLEPSSDFHPVVDKFPPGLPSSVQDVLQRIMRLKRLFKGLSGQETMFASVADITEAYEHKLEHLEQEYADSLVSLQSEVVKTASHYQPHPHSPRSSADQKQMEEQTTASSAAEPGMSASQPLTLHRRISEENAALMALLQQQERQIALYALRTNLLKRKADLTQSQGRSRSAGPLTAVAARPQRARAVGGRSGGSGAGAARARSSTRKKKPAREFKRVVRKHKKASYELLKKLERKLQTLRNELQTDRASDPILISELQQLRSKAVELRDSTRRVRHIAQSMKRETVQDPAKFPSADPATSELLTLDRLLKVNSVLLAQTRHNRSLLMGRIGSPLSTHLRASLTTEREVLPLPKSSARGRVKAGRVGTKGRRKGTPLRKKIKMVSRLSLKRSKPALHESLKAALNKNDVQPGSATNGATGGHPQHTSMSSGSSVGSVTKGGRRRKGGSKKKKKTKKKKKKHCEKSNKSSESSGIELSASQPLPSSFSKKKRGSGMTLAKAKHSFYDSPTRHQNRSVPARTALSEDEKFFAGTAKPNYTLNKLRRRMKDYARKAKSGALSATSGTDTGDVTSSGVEDAAGDRFRPVASGARSADESSKRRGVMAKLQQQLAASKAKKARRAARRARAASRDAARSDEDSAASSGSLRWVEDVHMSDDAGAAKHKPVFPGAVAAVASA